MIEGILLIAEPIQPPETPKHPRKIMKDLFKLPQEHQRRSFQKTNEPLQVGTPKAHKHKHFIGISLLYWRFFIRGFIWDIPILIFAHVLFWGPIFGCGVTGPKQ